MEAMNWSAEQGVRRRNELVRLCFQWMRENHPEVVERMQQRVVKEFPYLPKKTYEEKRQARNQSARARYRRKVELS